MQLVIKSKYLIIMYFSILFKKLDQERRIKEELMIKIQSEEKNLKVIL